MRNKRILILVEGQKEKRFFGNVAKAFFHEQQLEIVSFCCNIYALYKTIMEYGGNIDLVEALLVSKSISEEDKGKIRGAKYPWIYLVFDMDFQEKHFPDKEKLKRLRKLSKLFNNETEFGLLLIDYPMFESYFETSLSYWEFHENYKKRINSFGKDGDPRSFTKEGLLKAMSVHSSIASSLINQEQKNGGVADTLRTSVILETQIRKLLSNGVVACLNCASLLPLCYFGEKAFS